MMDYSLFRSRRVRTALRKAAEITAETGRETGLTVWKRRGSWKVEVEVGGLDAISEPEVSSFSRKLLEFDNFGLEMSLEEVMPGEQEFFRLHFHPSAEEAIIPSFTDLETFANLSREGMIAMGVGRVEKDGGITLLILETPPSEYQLLLLEEDWENLYPDLPPSCQEQINSLLEKRGVRTRMLSFSPTRRKRRKAS